MSEFQKIGAFDIICGSSQGGWTSREQAFEMLRYIERCEDAPNTPKYHFDFLGKYKELASLEDSEIDPQDYVEELDDYFRGSTLMPAYTSFVFNDGELRVTPYIDDQLPTMEDYPEDNHGVHSNEEGYNHIITVTDHGNCTLWEWKCSTTVPSLYKWKEVWSMV